MPASIRERERREKSSTIQRKRATLNHPTYTVPIDPYHYVFKLA